jgi:hypothetical protein
MRAGLDGPSRTIIVEPVEAPRELPRETESEPQPERMPEGEPEKCSGRRGGRAPCKSDSSARSRGRRSGSDLVLREQAKPEEYCCATCVQQLRRGVQPLQETLLGGAAA